MPGKEYQKKMSTKDYEEHINRIKHIKSVIDSSQPRKKLESKKKEIDRRRKNELIEMDNRLLLERLAKTMQHKTIDNENNNLKFKKSLIQTHRKLELQRITQENQRLLKRIQETEPCYNHLVWEEEAKKRAIYIRNMSEFQDSNNNNNTSSATRLHPIIRNKSATTRRNESTSNLLLTSNGERLRPISAPRARIPYNE